MLLPGYAGFGGRGGPSVHGCRGPDRQAAPLLLRRAAVSGGRDARKERGQGRRWNCCCAARIRPDPATITQLCPGEAAYRGYPRVYWQARGLGGGYLDVSPDQALSLLPS